ncbi:MAG: hypothetical protein J5942_03325 [Prevotella sp.]|nr:hypothetical protein [Prevotella sp.]
MDYGNKGRESFSYYLHLATFLYYIGRNGLATPPSPVMQREDCELAGTKDKKQESGRPMQHRKMTLKGIGKCNKSR